MAKDKVEVDVVANTRGSIRSIGKYTLSVAGAVLAVRALYKAGKNLIDAYAVQEKAETKLRSALRVTGKETRTAMTSLKDYASELQRVTVFGDEATLSAMAMIQQLGNLSENELKDVTKATLDFASAMDIDLTTAASLVGKTLGSSTNALTRYGVEVDMSLNKSDRLADMLDSMTGKFGGMAEAAGEDATAALVQFGNAMGDLKERGGGFIARALEEPARAFTQLATMITDAIDAKRLMDTVFEGGSQDFEKAIILQRVALQKTRDAYQDWATGLKSDYEGTDLGAAFTNKLLNDISAEQEKLVWLQQRLRDVVGDVPADIPEGVSDVDKVLAWKGELISAFDDIDKAGLRWGDSVDVVAEKNKIFGDILSEMAEDDFRTYGDGILSLKDFFADQLSPAIEKATEDLSTFGLILGGGVDAPLRMPTSAPQPGTTMPIAAPGLPTATPEQIFGDFKALAGSFEDTMAQAPLWFDPLELSLINIQNEEDIVAQKAIDMAEAFQESAKEYIKGTTLITGAFSTMFQGMGKSAIEGGDAMKEAMKSTFASILGGLAQMVWASTAASLALALGGDVTKWAAVAEGAFAGGIISTAQGFITAMRDGGTVTRPTLAMIGEAGPETVTRADRGGRGGMTMINHFHGTLIQERQAARSIGRLLYQDARGH